MDELDLLKKDWNNPSPYKKLSANDIYPLLHKKSSSIVKTLFYISIAELAFWLLLNFVPYSISESFRKKLDEIYTNDILLDILSAISLGIILLFIYLLYKSYRSISVTDSAKTLMENILKTRKIIKYYVIYNLVLVIISFALGIIHSINYDPNTSKMFSHFTAIQITVFIAVFVVILGICLLIVWLFYKLIYGILLKRLNRNYNELKKIEL
ncbi:MAG: hypothetical protein ACK5MZ_08905 [Aestuariibaculum sp.]